MTRRSQHLERAQDAGVRDPRVDGRLLHRGAAGGADLRSLAGGRVQGRHLSPLGGEIKICLPVQRKNYT